VIKGSLGVKTDKGYTTTLYPGQAFTVEPGVYHDFHTYTSHTTIVEVAYVQYTEHDIDRKELGGAINEDDQKAG
jgi:D-lyxose ketol-isomerase|tara:strand:+ start:379 stop:600 length:222 start_codon:yes stop_codon:yes gene_type:complete